MSVSIILATYNGSAYLSRAIDSIIAQTYQDRELIIINDASTDHTLKIIQDYATRDSRIRRYTNTHNLERSRSRNRGIMHSTGEYIAFIDDDDVWIDTHKLDKQVEFLTSHPDYSIVGTRAINVDQHGNPHTKQFDRLQTDQQIRDNFLRSNQYIFSTVMGRKIHLVQAGLFNPSLYLAEDYDVRLRCGIVGKCHILPDYSIRYTSRSNNTTNTGQNARGIRRNCLMLARSYQSYYPAMSARQRCRLLIGVWIPPSRYQYKQILTDRISTKKPSNKKPNLTQTTS